MHCASISDFNLHLKFIKPKIHEEPPKIETHVYEQVCFKKKNVYEQGDDEMKTTLVIMNCITLAIGNM